MKVFFTSSFKDKEEYQEIYNKILETIDIEGEEVISLAKQDYSHLIPKKLIKTTPENELNYTWLKKGIKKSNCVIIEASKDSFRLGHEATLALLYNKPVLCLSNKMDYSLDIINPKFYAHMYKDVNDIPLVIQNFLKEVNNKHMGLRKNIYITSEYKNFLTWYGTQSKKNDSEIIRDLIQGVMDSNPEYDIADLSDLNVDDKE